MKIVPQSVEYLGGTSEALKLIETAGRTCWKSEDKIEEGSEDAFIRMIISKGHDSVLEHASATFRIITDRGISHEIVRHRIGMSYSQESTRYVKYGDIEVIEPTFKDIQQTKAWANSCKKAEEEYAALLDSGVTAQWARSVLPNSLKTEIVVTGNFRAWRHFLKLRMAKAAHPQIREVAAMIHGWFRAAYPVIVEDMEQ